MAYATRSPGRDLRDALAHRFHGARAFAADSNRRVGFV